MIKASPEFFRTAGNGSLIFLDTPFVSAFTTCVLIYKYVNNG